MNHSDELASGNRFGFGKNWLQYSQCIDDDVVNKAMQHLTDQLGVNDLCGMRFVDIGSGSGLFSLAAYKLGASVCSIDYDPESIVTTKLLRDKIEINNDRAWEIEEGSVLDEQYLLTLGKFDIVYSWGVLHHTGSMWKAINNVAEMVSENGRVFISIYNDQGLLSKYWLLIKKTYNKNFILKMTMIIIHWPYLYLLRRSVRLIRRTPLERGMSLWYDMIDWLGGLPFEVAKPEHIFDFLYKRGFQLEKLTTVRNRAGCNEFVMKREASN